MHSKKFKKIERRGLPGGPNEMFTYVTGVFSTDGYKNGSPDINNPFNIIPSGNITMKDVDFPVIGIDNLGNKKMMMPGGEYEFPGDMVFEVPMAQGGGTITEAPGFFDNVVSDARSFVRYPFATIKQKFKYGDVPYNFDKGIDSGAVDKDAFTKGIDFFNPINAVYKANKALGDDNYTDASLNALSILPLAKPLKALKGVSPAQAKILAKSINKGSKSTQMQDGGESFLDYAKRRLLRSLNPFAQADDTLQMLGVPSNLIREGIEGISGYFGDEGGYGDGEWNWGDIVPDIENTSILDDTKAQKPISEVLEVEGFVPQLVVDLVTDPSSYVGAGVAKNVIKKAGTTSIPKLIKAVVPKIKNAGDDVIKKSADDVVEMVEDLFGKKIKKSDAVRLNRVEDANVSNTTFSKPNPDGSLPYETGNWFSSTGTPFYVNNTKKAGTSELLNPHSNKRLLTTYLSPDDAKNFNILNMDPNTSAYALSGGRGNLPIPTEYVIPPPLVSRLRNQGKVGQASEILGAMQDFYKMYGGDLPKAQRGFFTKLIKEGAKKLDDFIPAIQRELRSLEKSTGLYSKDNLLKEVAVPGSDVTIQSPTNLAKFLDYIGFNKLTGRNSYLPHWARRDDGAKVVAQATPSGPYAFSNKGMKLLYNPKGNYYTIPEAFISNPLTAGRTFKSMQDFMPKGSILKQGPEGSLSTDSFKLMMNRLKRGQFSDVTNYSDPNVSRYLNTYGKGSRGTSQNIHEFTDAIDDLEASMFRLQNQGKVGEGFTGFGRRNAGSNFEIGVPNLTIRKNYTEGGSVSWMWKGKSYSGTLIPSMENENNRYARTKNGKIKTLPKKKMGGKLRIYKDYVDGVYDKSPSRDYVEKVYDKLNRVYLSEAKQANMSTPNYIMSYLVDE